MASAGTGTPASSMKREHTGSEDEETAIVPKRARRKLKLEGEDGGEEEEMKINEEPQVDQEMNLSEDDEGCGEEEQGKAMVKEEKKDVKPRVAAPATTVNEDIYEDEAEDGQAKKRAAAVHKPIVKDHQLSATTVKAMREHAEREKRRDEEAEEEDGAETERALKRAAVVHKPILKNHQLQSTTTKAMREQTEREERLKIKRENQVKHDEGLLQKFAQEEKKNTVRRLVLDRTEDGIDIEVLQRLVPLLKPHQVEGIKFMWDNCYESLERIAAKTDDDGVDTGGSGCILAHCMGLGKTLSVIALIHALLANHEVTNTQRILVLCPLNTAVNWANEFTNWLGHKNIKPEIKLFQFAFQKKDRIEFLDDWHTNGGVLFMGYEIFRALTLLDEDDMPPKKVRKPPAGAKPKKAKRQKSQEDIDLIKEYRHYLRDPGPDLVVCDEGHMIKNAKAGITISVNKIRTLRRIVLTGTPMQNNLTEYYSMIHFVKPNLLGSEAEFNNRFKIPIIAGQYKHSDPDEVMNMKRRSFVLHDMLKTTIHRRDFSVLRQFLPPKFEYAVKLQIRDVQKELYEKYLKDQNIRPDQALDVAKLFGDYSFLMKVWTHPWLLRPYFVDRFNKGDAFDWEEYDKRQMLAGPQSEDEEDEPKKKSTKKPAPKKQQQRQQSDEESGDEAMASSSTVVATPRMTRARKAAKMRASTADPDSDEEEMEYDPLTTAMQKQWWFPYFGEDAEYDLGLSGKLEFFKAVLEQCELIGDKLLVFTRSLLVLNYFEELLKRWKMQSGAAWKKGKSYFRMDGSVSIKQRADDIKMFNNPSNVEARLYIISTMAGGIGINLFSANRVIILDASWNPAHDLQAMFRSYRLGQKKPVYIYRLMCKGTMEEKIYKRQIAKQAMSQRVVDAQQLDRHFTANELQEMYRFQPDLHEPLDEYDAGNVQDTVLKDLMKSMGHSIVSYREHDSLLTHREEETLTEQDQKLAREQDEQGADYMGHIRGGGKKKARTTKKRVKATGVSPAGEEEGDDEEEEEYVPPTPKGNADSEYDEEEEDDADLVLAKTLSMGSSLGPPTSGPTSESIVKGEPAAAAAPQTSTVPKEDKYARLKMKKEPY